MLVEPLSLGGRSLRAGTYVWLFGRGPDGCEVEFEDRRHRVPCAALVESPVPRPPLAELRRLDPCFGLPDQAFDEVAAEQFSYRYLRCKAHGQLFLEDWRGGIADYVRLIFVGDLGDRSFADAWIRFHRIPDDLLNFRGIAL